MRDTVAASLPVSRYYSSAFVTLVMSFLRIRLDFSLRPAQTPGDVKAGERGQAMAARRYMVYRISVESGRIVQSFPRCRDLERKTLDEANRLVKSRHGWIYPLSLAVAHTCMDLSNVDCDACESANHPTDRKSYVVMLKKTG